MRSLRGWTWSCRNSSFNSAGSDVSIWKTTRSKLHSLQFSWNSITFLLWTKRERFIEGFLVVIVVVFSLFVYGLWYGLLVSFCCFLWYRSINRLNERTKEWTIERSSERAKERTNEQASERRNQQASKRTNEWTKKPTSERASERTNEWTRGTNYNYMLIYIWEYDE